MSDQTETALKRQFLAKTVPDRALRFAMFIGMGIGGAITIGWCILLIKLVSSAAGMLLAK